MSLHPSMGWKVEVMCLTALEERVRWKRAFVCREGKKPLFWA